MFVYINHSSATFAYFLLVVVVVVVVVIVIIIIIVVVIAAAAVVVVIIVVVIVFVAAVLINLEITQRCREVVCTADSHLNQELVISYISLVFSSCSK